MAKELLGARLRKLREDKGLSRVEFAKRVGASPASVWNWESGTAPRGKAIAAIARVLGISEEFLTSGSGGAARPRGGDVGAPQGLRLPSPASWRTRAPRSRGRAAFPKTR